MDISWYKQQLNSVESKGHVIVNIKIFLKNKILRMSGNCLSLFFHFHYPSQFLTNNQYLDCTFSFCFSPREQRWTKSATKYSFLNFRFLSFNTIYLDRMNNNNVHNNKQCQYAWHVYFTHRQKNSYEDFRSVTAKLNF